MLDMTFRRQLEAMWLETRVRVSHHVPAMCCDRYRNMLGRVVCMTGSPQCFSLRLPQCFSLSLRVFRRYPHVLHFFELCLPPVLHRKGQVKSLARCFVSVPLDWYMFRSFSATVQRLARTVQVHVTSLRARSFCTHLPAVDLLFVFFG